MGFGYEPTKLRVYNTVGDERGTKTFRLTARPLNGIMNLTYTDPVTGEDIYCDARCPLAHNSSLPYQDFRFVNVVGMNGFQIDISDWYGSGAGLAGLELFQDKIFAYAVDDFNEPSCAVGQFPSSSSQSGTWSPSLPGHSGPGYLVADSSDVDPPFHHFRTQYQAIRKLFHPHLHARLPRIQCLCRSQHRQCDGFVEKHRRDDFYHRRVPDE